MYSITQDKKNNNQPGAASPQGPFCCSPARSTAAGRGIVFFALLHNGRRLKELGWSYLMRRAYYFGMLRMTLEKGGD